MMRFRIFLLVLASLIFASIPLVFAHASPQADKSIRVIHLSDSSFEQAHAVSFSSDGKYIAVGGTSGVYLLDFQVLSIIEFIRTNTWARSVAFVPGSDVLAAGLFDNTVKFWNIPDAQQMSTIADPKGWVRSISFSADGSLLAAASDDNTIRVWQVHDHSSVLVLDKNTTGVRAIALSPDGKLVAGALGDKTVRVWSVPSGELLYTLIGHEDWVRCLAFSPDGRLLASGAFDKTVRIWNMLDGTIKGTLKGHSSSVLGVAFSPDGKTLASGSVDKTVRLWNVSDGTPIRVLQGHENFVYSVAFSPDGKTLASVSADNTVRLWDMNVLGKAAVNAQLPMVSTPSDCRVCHHRHGQIEPAPVIELNCENCHAGGISLSWCAGFPRSNRIEKTPIAYHAVDDVSGVPIGDRHIAVMIASPGNGETLYVRGNFMAPEFIGGKIFYEDSKSLPDVKVHLDIISDGKTTSSLETYPTESGAFTFNVAINFDSPPPHFSRPGTRQCLVCHGDFRADADLPKGDVHVVVTAITPNGEKATDDRWIHVDQSHDVSIPVQVLDDKTGNPVQGISVEASTILYQWRGRFESLTSSLNGEAQFNLETLTQADTVYNFSIPPQVLNGVLYASSEPVALNLAPNSTSQPTIALKAHALTGQIHGELSATELSNSLEGTKMWAIQLPAGPAYQTSLDAENRFAFENIPVSEYLVLPDDALPTKQGLSTTIRSLDLFESPMVNVSLSAEKMSRLISGSVIAKEGSTIPFAWVAIGNKKSVFTVDPMSGKFILPNFPSDAMFITVTAPGYYSVPQSIKKSMQELNVNLSPRPETRFIPWGNGQVVLPPETKGSVDGLNFNLEYGWIWGYNTSTQPLQIHLPGVDIHMTSGQFALEQPADGKTGWLYLPKGQAEVIYNGKPTSVNVGSGEMIALMKDASAFPIESAVTTALHPALEESPVFEIIEPSLSAHIQNWLAKTGIGALQTITFITYILSLVTLFTVPFIGLFSYWKKRRSLSNSQENH